MRKPIAFTVSLAVVCGLFLAMSWMIEAEGITQPVQPPPTVRLVDADPPEPPDSSKPDDPVVPDPPPDVRTDLVVDVVPPVEDVDIDVEIDSPGTGGLLQVTREFARGNQADPIPVVGVQPMYPDRAAQEGVEGWVRVEFTIEADGSVSNARVVEAFPRRGIFDQAAITAISRWRFRPAMEDGVAVASPGRRVTIDFNLAGSL